MLVDLFSVSFHETVKLFSKAFLPKVLLPAHHVEIWIEIALSIVICKLTALVERRCCWFGFLDFYRLSRRGLVLRPLSNQLFSLLLHLLQIGQLNRALFTLLRS